MSDRARIGIERDDGTVTSVHLPWGHPDSVVSLLTTHYSNAEAVEELLELGDLSKLGDSPASSVALGRDEGMYAPPQVYESAEAYLDDAGQTAIWHYLYQSGEWRYAEGGYRLSLDELLARGSDPF